MAEPKEIDSLQRKNESTVTIILGIYWGYIRIMAKKMETTIQGLGLIIHNKQPLGHT